MNIQWQPPFGAVQTAALILLGIGAAAALYLRWEWRQRAQRHVALLILRGLIALLLALILLNPTVSESSLLGRAKQPFFVLIDTSRSMAHADAGLTAQGDSTAPLPRFRTVQKAVLENRSLLDALRQRYDVRFYGFDAGMQAANPDTLRQKTPEGGSTEIGQALSQVVNMLPPAASVGPNAPASVSGGALLVSDGRDNGAIFPPEAARAVRGRGLPVYTVCIGQETQARDIRISAQRPQAFSAPGQKISLSADIAITGLSGGAARVDLLREGRRIASRTVPVSPGRREIAFPVTEPRKGFFRYALACAVAPGETNEANNRANVFLNVLPERARVLLLEGSPSWDAKFLAQSLRSDSTLTLDTVSMALPGRPFALSGDPARPEIGIPRALEGFARYDVLILGKGYEEFFDAGATEALKRWVGERGGNLVFLRGRADERAPALRELEPVAFGAEEIAVSRARLTEAGRAYPGFAFTQQEDAQAIVQRLPALVSATRVEGEKALSVVLARAPEAEGGENAQEMALLAYQRFGQGKTLAVIGEGLWRWAFLPPDLAAYAKVYDEFWTQTIRWLVSDSDFLPGRSLALRADRAAYALQDTVNLLGFTREAQFAAPPPIAITQPDGKTITLAAASGAGRGADFAAAFHPSMPGEYLASVMPLGQERATPATAAFTVYPGQKEDANRSANPALMAQIAAAGGGELLTLEQLPALPEKLHAQEQASRRADAPRSLWDSGWLLALLVGLLTAEWLQRRRFGLP